MTNNNDLIKKLKIGFMGTPSFAVPILNSLIKDNYHIEFVYTQSGRPAGRGLRKKNSEIYEVAKTKNINYISFFSLGRTKFDKGFCWEEMDGNQRYGYCC